MLAGGRSTSVGLAAFGGRAQLQRDLLPRIVTEVAIAQQERIKSRVIAAPNAAQVANGVQHRANASNAGRERKPACRSHTLNGLAAPMDRRCTRLRRL